MNQPKKNLKLFGIGKIISYAKPYKGLILLMLILGMGVSVANILVPLFQKYALDHFVRQATLDTLWLFITLYILLILTSGGMNALSTYLSFKIEMLIKRDFRNKAFSHLQTLSFSYFNKNSVGYIHSRIMSDVTNIGQLITWRMMDALWQLTYIVGAIAVMLSINANLTLMILVILPLIVLLFSLFQNKLIRVNREIREINAQITSDFNEEITGAKTIKTLAIEKKMGASFFRDTQRIQDKTVQAAHIRGLFAGAMHLASSLALAIVLWKGGVIAQTQVGTFSLFMAYAQGMMEPIRWIIESISELITTQVNIERFTDLLATKSDVVDTPEVVEKYGDSFHPKKENWEPIKGDIAFEDVSFHYPDGDENILSHFNLQIPFGTNVAIVGETGAGKSTLVNLICRFFEPTAGKVLIDGRDARERSQLWLHSSIGYVLQTPHLFSGTVRDNLLYGNAQATEEEIYKALDLVSAREVVDKLENGLDSDVGEGGDLLSAGEKQLISFARALLSNPKILILDEATASVDTITEQKIQAAMHTVIQGRTSIVIAHRLSTVCHADIILVVKDGKIIEQGKHRELLKQKGYYYTLYTKQYEAEVTSAALNQN